MLFWLLAVPFLGVLLPGLAGRMGRLACGLAAGLVPALGLALLLSLAPDALDGTPVVASVDWIPTLGLRLSLMLDGLGVLLAGMVLGIGLLVVVYGYAYLGTKYDNPRFFAYLLLFMGAMLGVVLSADLIATVVFWELTSISSFLLIGFTSYKREARRGARMALTVTGLGGLGLLGGAVLLVQLAGTSDLIQLAGMREAITAHALYPYALALILLGAFTKSAQFPFHFWLPRAMAAPTPVSAYLHSATMVKAGVFLLARLHPALGGTDLWFWAVAGTGLTTALVGGLLANRAHDLKGLLAYSTIGHLGLIVALLGVGTEKALAAAGFHILNHALFKAALFMSAGIVDLQVGTRDLRALGGLRRSMPITAGLAVVASAAMAGLPPMGGFISKEGFLEVLLRLSTPTVGGLIGLAVSLLGVGYAMRFAYGAFFARTPASFPREPVDPGVGMWGPVAVLTAGALLLGLFPHTLASAFVEQVAVSMNGHALHHHVHLALWHGLNVALGISALGIGLGLALWRYGAAGLVALPIPDAERAFDLVVANAVGGARAARALLEPTRLPSFLALCALVIALLVGPGLVGAVASGALPAPRPIGQSDVLLLAGAVLLAITALAAVRFRERRILAVIAVGAVGSLLSFAFVALSAPDLALTQISVEVATVVLILLALRHLPAEAPRHVIPWERARDVTLSVAIGLGAAALTWLLLTDPVTSATSAFYLEQSKPGGGGTNVVNVILVDFRGFDTFGEGTVLGIAALGVYAMIDGMGLRPQGSRPDSEDEAAHPLMLVVVARLILPLALTVAAYIFLRGHNLPGGGFVAGLVVAITLVLQVLASGFDWWRERVATSYHLLIAAGVLITMLTGVAPWFFDRPFLTSWYDYFHPPVIGELELASAAAFDLGVFLSVVGALLLVLVNLGKLPTRPDDVTSHPEER